MILHGHDSATKPWEQDKFHVNDPALLEWAHHHHHYALLGLIISSDMLLGRMRSLILQTTNVQGDVKLLNLLVESQKFNREVDGLFKGAASGGHRDRIERLLAAKADVNAAAYQDNGRTALQAAAEGSHLEIVERLLTAKADVNAAAAAKYNGRTALQAAAEGGHLEIVERLLIANADVNGAAADYSGRTALQAAEEGGHTYVVTTLQQAGAR